MQLLVAGKMSPYDSGMDRLAAADLESLGPWEEFCRARLKPGRKAELVVPLARMFNHYPLTANPVGLPPEAAQEVLRQRQQVREDWAECVAEYPLWAVETACKAWLWGDKGNFAPKMADIRRHCDAIVAPWRRQVGVIMTSRRLNEHRAALDAMVGMKK